MYNFDVSSYSIQKLSFTSKESKLYNYKLLLETIESSVLKFQTDHAHHTNNGYRALTELVQFDQAVQRAVDLTAESDTLIVVTADHSHTLTVGGYSDRGNPITGGLFCEQINKNKVSLLNLSKLAVL